MFLDDSGRTVRLMQSAPTPPRTRPLGTVTSLSMSAPRPKHFVGRVRAEEPDPEDPEDPGDPASSPSLLDKRMEIASQTFGGWIGLATACDVSIRRK